MASSGPGVPSMGIPSSRARDLACACSPSTKALLAAMTVRSNKSRTVCPPRSDGSKLVESVYHVVTHGNRAEVRSDADVPAHTGSHVIDAHTRKQRRHDQLVVAIENALIRDNAAHPGTGTRDKVDTFRKRTLVELRHHEHALRVGRDF